MIFEFCIKFRSNIGTWRFWQSVGEGVFALMSNVWVWGCGCLVAWLCGCVFVCQNFKVLKKNSNENIKDLYWSGI